MEHYKLLIIGGGAAGMAAAIAAKEAGCGSVLLVERDERLGGVLPQCLHHGFGLARFHEDLRGAEYAERFLSPLAECGALIETGCAVLDIAADRTVLLSSAKGLRRVSFDHCILAAGCREKPAGALGLAGTRPAGVFTAGTAQRLMNSGGCSIGEHIVILGSGDIGQIMARQLIESGRRIVLMAEIRDTLGGLARNRRDCIEAYSVPVRLRSTVTELHGFPRLTAVTLRNLADGTDELIPCDTLITALGLIPERELIAPLLQSGSLPAWLHLTGNCEKVHDIVDSVTAEAEALGRALGGET